MNSVESGILETMLNTPNLGYNTQAYVAGFGPAAIVNCAAVSSSMIRDSKNQLNLGTTAEYQ